MSRIRAWVTAGMLAVTVTLIGGPAQAADGAAITHVKPTAKGLQVLVSVPQGTNVDLNGVTVEVDGKPADATAAMANDSGQIRRTTVLVMDTSNSMKGDRFVAAQQAAKTFLDTVPDDVYVGITTFAADVTPALQPTLDREAARGVLEGLTLSKQTRLYDGVVAAAKMAGKDGQRSILVLSDGADTSNTPLADATAAISDGGLLVDVVAIDQSGPALSSLQSLASAGDGDVISADPAALQAAFTEEADALARQLLVTVTVPSSVTAEEGNLVVSLPTGGSTLTAEAFTTLVQPSTGDGDSTKSTAPARTFHGFALPPWTLYVAVGLVGLGLVVMFTGLVPKPEKTELSPDERVTKYTEVTTGIHQQDDAKEDALATAKFAAAQMLGHNKSLEARIAARLEAAGSDLKPAEWLLIHAGIMVLAGMVGLLLTKSLIVGFIFTLLGIVLPWAFLGFKKGRRLKAFNTALPDTLQLMAGSLQAGLSLAQSVDTIVREGTEPITSEFKRVLVETRLGVSLEDALEGITERFESKDFAWVVMAIKIQRQVGGNLAELLNTVAGTIREREYMRRQVAALAAEGKLSAIVLGGLPPAFLMYLLLVNRDYVMPMFTSPMGWVMLGGAAILLSVGVFWMSRLVKVEV